MSASNAFETMLLEYLFEATAIPGLGAELYIGLHTGNPGEAGDQSTFEATYTGYSRVQVTRASLNWDTVGDVVSNVEEIAFGEASAGSETITHFSVGMAISGAGTLMFYGAIDTPVLVQAGVSPRFKAGQLQVSVD